MRGYYIIFEGIVGTGKSTQSKKLVETLKKEFPKTEVIWTREPGGTEISEAIRKVVQGTSFKEEMEPICEAYLYAASRAQALRKVVKPALKRGAVVISDRSFLTSYTIQAFAREIGLDKVRAINNIAIEVVEPDNVIFLDLPINTGLSRTEDHDGDKFESFPKEFYEKIKKGYDTVKELPEFNSKWIDISAEGSEEEVFERIKGKIVPLILAHFDK
jgi:dTMP kinase